jgi:hypothetical protein
MRANHDGGAVLAGLVAIKQIEIDEGTPLALLKLALPATDPLPQLPCHSAASRPWKEFSKNTTED